MTRKKRSPGDLDYDMELMSSNYEISCLFDKIIKHQGFNQRRNLKNKENIKD